MFLLWLRQLPCCGDRTPAPVPPPTEGRSSPTNTAVLTPRSFILPSFGWFYIFFSTGQVLLSTLSWCSACTSVSEGVFLMYPWRDMYSTPTYSSAILLFSLCVLFDDSCSDGYEVICHCSFDLYFLDGWWCWTSFHVLVGHLHFYFGKMSLQFCPFLNWVVPFL